jgi:hypothetical protein
MITTEAEARRKWCPLVRVRANMTHGASAGYNVTRLTATEDVKDRIYAFFFPSLHNYTRGRFFKCRGSGCMSWRWIDRQHGFCGEFGSPDAGEGAQDPRVAPPSSTVRPSPTSAGDTWLVIGSALSIAVLAYALHHMGVI